MKKTMIALVALSGLAMADTIDKDILTIPSSISRIGLSDAGTQGWKQSIGGGMGINATDVAIDLAMKVAGSAVMPDGWSWGIANLDPTTDRDGDFTTDSAYNSFSFIGRGAYGGEFAAGIVDVADLVAATDNATGISALTFNFQTPTKQSSTTFSVWHWDGESTAATALVDKTNNLSTALAGNSFSWTGKDLTKGKILVVFSDSSYGGANTVSLWNATATLNIASVPEPATATLSLLALAGLAARRRRH